MFLALHDAGCFQLGQNVTRSLQASLPPCLADLGQLWSCQDCRNALVLGLGYWELPDLLWMLRLEFCCAWDRETVSAPCWLPLPDAVRAVRQEVEFAEGQGYPEWGKALLVKRKW